MAKNMSGVHYGSIARKPFVLDGLELQNESTETNAAAPSTRRHAHSSVIMKSIACILLVFTLLQSTSGWAIPKTMLHKAAALATLSAAIAAGPAVADTGINFGGSYADPNHPNCLREVRMITPSQAAVTGTDGTPGCPPDGSGRPWSLTGKVEQDTILIDFSPKGGPKNLKGVWEPSPVPGIRFPDGNLWSKKYAQQ